MSDTPRTDAEVAYVRTESPDEVVDAKFARQLEREVAALRENAERYRWLYNGDVPSLVVLKLSDTATSEEAEQYRAWSIDGEAMEKVIDAALKKNPQ